MLSLITKLQTSLSPVLTKEEGQGLVEYALILALIALVVVGAVTLLGSQVKSGLSSVAPGI